MASCGNGVICSTRIREKSAGSDDFRAGASSSSVSTVVVFSAAVAGIAIAVGRTVGGVGSVVVRVVIHAETDDMS